MAEAEDVLLEAAERVARGARAWWARRQEPGGSAEAAAAVGRRRLDCWLAACFGRSFALVEVDAPPRSGWLARMWGHPAPWHRRPLAVASTDGRCLFLPCDSLVRLGSSPAASDLLPALGLGMRAAWGGGGSAPKALPLERDVFWVVEGALVDVALAGALPGLTGEIEAARQAALGARPPLTALRPAERAAEELVRSLLRAPVADTGTQIAHIVGGAMTRTRLAEFAERFSASRDAGELRSYRGIAPIPHWGIPGDRAERTGLVVEDTHEREGAHRVPGRRLRRRIARRRPDPRDSRTQAGPFLLPSSDPHLSVQDARGLDRPPDHGEEEVDTLTEELARLPELPTVGVEHPVREILEDGGNAPSIRSGRAAQIDSDARVLAYPEWDYRSQGYRLRGCLLRERGGHLGGDATWAAELSYERAALQRRVRRQFEAIRPRRKRMPRRLDGDGIDLDGWALEFAERRAGHAPGGRLYTEDRPARRDVAVALLIDASGSTDAWVSKSQRVIDVAKEAALCFCEALTALGDRLAVYAFSGQGSRDVRIWVPKRFEDPYGDRVRARIGALQPDRFTRLGGPIRHVTASLGRTGSRVRLLLLLSDGKPNDEDSYDGEYGVEDVRHAVAEAGALGVRPFCITIDRAGPSYLPRIFGPSGYMVLWDVEQLPLRLPRLYRQLTAGAG